MVLLAWLEPNSSSCRTQFSGAHQKMFLHAILAHTSNDATDFQGINDRSAALTSQKK